MTPLLCFQPVSDRPRPVGGGIIHMEQCAGRVSSHLDPSQHQTLPDSLEKWQKVGCTDCLILQELHVHNSSPVKKRNQHQLLATHWMPWHLRSVVSWCNPLPILLFGTGLHQVKPRLICCDDPVDESWILPAPPEKVLTKMTPLSPVDLCQLMGDEFSHPLLEIQVLPEQSPSGSMRNAQRIGQPVDAHSPVVLHKYLALSNPTPCACSLGRSLPHQIAQLCSAKSEGCVPLVHRAFLVAILLEHSLHVSNSVLGILAQTH